MSHDAGMEFWLNCHIECADNIQVLQLDRGNVSNALADNLLNDLGLTSDDYNNGTTIQLLAFLTAEFPVQFLTKRYGFKLVLPTMMMGWGMASWGQSWMHDRTSCTQCPCMRCI
jgi:hypothetical protein